MANTIPTDSVKCLIDTLPESLRYSLLDCRDGVAVELQETGVDERAEHGDCDLGLGRCIGDYGIYG